MRERFFNRLSDGEFSEEDSVHAQRVWFDFNCRTLQDYIANYLLADVSLLAKVFENFRRTLSVNTILIEPTLLAQYSWR